MNHITSDAMQKFYDMTRKDPVIEVEGRPYCLSGYEPVTSPKIKPLTTHTLQGIVDAVESDFERLADLGAQLHIHVHDPTHVFLETGSIGPFLQRNILIQAEAYVTDFRFGHGYDTEQFIIALMTQFVQNDDWESILKLVSRMTKETAGTISDDGISQKMEVKQGISMRDKVEVKNPFRLQPFRTFTEIKQPESEFVFRVKDNDGQVQCSIHEADGAKWKIEAIESIKAFFTKALPDATVIA